MWINPGHLASRTEFCVKTGPEFSETHNTLIVPAEGGGDELMQISNTVIMPCITQKFRVTIKFVTFDMPIVSNIIYRQFITHPPYETTRSQAKCPSAVAIKGKSETQIYICSATIFWFHIFGQTSTAHFPQTWHQLTRNLSRSPAVLMELLKLNAKNTLEQATKAQWGSRCKPLLFPQPRR
jgi:hypothetical protein